MKPSIGSARQANPGPHRSCRLWIRRENCTACAACHIQSGSIVTSSAMRTVQNVQERNFNGGNQPTKTWPGFTMTFQMKMEKTQSPPNTHTSSQETVIKDTISGVPKPVLVTTCEFWTFLHPATEEVVFVGQICADVLQQDLFCKCVSLETCLISVPSSAEFLIFLSEPLIT